MYLGEQFLFQIHVSFTKLHKLKTLNIGMKVGMMLKYLKSKLQATL